MLINNHQLILLINLLNHHKKLCIKCINENTLDLNMKYKYEVNGFLYELSAINELRIKVKILA